MTSGEGASAFFTDVDRNVSAENPELGKLTRIGESHGLRFPLPLRALSSMVITVSSNCKPELRLKHWIDRNFGVRDSEVRSNLNEVEFLLGVVF